MDDTPRPLMEHLEELRRRLFWIFGTWAVALPLAVAFDEQLFRFMSEPAVSVLLEHGRKLQALKPAEIFFTYLKTALLASFMVALPMTLYQMWAFVAPGLYPSEKRLALPFVVSTTLLFLLGDAFGHQVAFPVMFQYFLSLEGDLIENAWTASDVFAFMSRMYLAFGISFQLPVIMVFLSTAGVVTPEMLSASRKYAVVAMFVIGAILTPPDVVSQIMLSVPLLILYESGILAARLLRRRRAARAAAESLAQ